MKNIFFMHIPKCGGTSFITSISKYYTNDKIFRLSGPASTKAYKSVGFNGMIQEFRLGLLMYLFYVKRYEFICGHFFFNDMIYEQFGNEWKFITIVRDPVSRFLSHYFYNRYLDSDHHRINDDLDVFLSKPAAKSFGDIMLKYFSGSVDNLNLDKAKRNIDKFTLIGDLDNLKPFTFKLKEYTGLQLDIGHINVNPLGSSEQEEFLSNEIVDKISLVCKPDIELYDYLKSHILTLER